MERKRALSDRDWDRYRCACCSDFSNNASKLQCHPSDIYSISGSVSTSFRESHHHPVTSLVPVVSHYQMDTTPPLTHGKFVSRWWCGTNELLLVVWEILLVSYSWWGPAAHSSWCWMGFKVFGIEAQVPVPSRSWIIKWLVKFSWFSCIS